MLMNSTSLLPTCSIVHRLILLIAKRNVAYYMLLCRRMCSIETDQSMTWWLLLRVERGRGVCVYVGEGR